MIKFIVLVLFTVHVRCDFKVVDVKKIINDMQRSSTEAYIKLLKAKQSNNRELDFEAQYQLLSEDGRYGFLTEASIDYNSFITRFKLPKAYTDIRSIQVNKFVENSGYGNEMLIARNGNQYDLIDIRGTVHDSIEQDGELLLSSSGYSNVYYIKQHSITAYSIKGTKNPIKRESHDQMYSRLNFKFDKKEEIEVNSIDLETALFITDYKDSQKVSFAVVGQDRTISVISENYYGKVVDKTTNSTIVIDEFQVIDFAFPNLRLSRIIDNEL